MPTLRGRVEEGTLMQNWAETTADVMLTIQGVGGRIRKIRPFAFFCEGAMSRGRGGDLAETKQFLQITHRCRQA